jgi:hypothetical protein
MRTRPAAEPSFRPKATRIGCVLASIRGIETGAVAPNVFGHCAVTPWLCRVAHLCARSSGVLSVARGKAGSFGAALALRVDAVEPAVRPRHGAAKRLQ